MAPRSLSAVLALVLTAATALATLTPAVGASACGEVVLDVVNPDLTPRADGFVHASGSLLVQIAAEGDRAADVDEVTLALGRHLPASARACDPLPLTGAYALAESVDADARDGLFLPLNSTSLLDGDYAAALRAFDADGNELGRRLLDVRVENGRTTVADTATVDRVAPWPRILPGDGDQLQSGQGLTIEFAERVASVEVHLNGASVGVDPWTPPAADAGPVPDPLGSDVNATGYRYAPGVKDGDVVRVLATDPAGNIAEKTVRIGDGPSGTGTPSGSTGGTMTVTLPEGREHAARAGDTVRIPVAIANPGTQSVTALLHVQAPSVVNATLDPASVDVPGNASADATVVARVADSARAGFYTLIVSATWTEGGEDRSATREVVVHVGGSEGDGDAPDAPADPDAGSPTGEDLVAQDAPDTDADTGPDGRERGLLGVPGVGVLGALAGGAVAGSAGARRRR